MTLIALTPAYDATDVSGSSISIKLVGVILASLSSGGGELSFLGLTHFYGSFSLAAWGSGTGAAGLVGAGMYALATTSFGFSVKATLLASACLPAVMVVSFFVLLPRGPLRALARVREGYQVVPEEQREGESGDGDDGLGPGGDESRDMVNETEGLLGPPVGSETGDAKATPTEKGEISWKLFKTNLKRAKGLFIPL